MNKRKKSGIIDFAIGLALTLATLAAFYFEWTPTHILECKVILIRDCARCVSILKLNV